MGRVARFHAVPARCSLLWYVDKSAVEVYSSARSLYKGSPFGEYMASDLAKRIRLIREAETSGRAEFSQLIGISKKTIEGMEQTGRTPKGELLEAVCKQWPKYTLWLMTDQTDEANGQVSPREENMKRMSMPDSIEYIGKYSLIEIRDVLKKNMKDRGITNKQVAKETGLSEKDLNEFFNRSGNIVKDKECELKAYIYLMQSDFLDGSLLERINSVSYVISERLPG